MEEIKKTLLNALACYVGDDLARARVTFRGLDATAMGAEWGSSGQTPDEILHGYEEHVRKCNRAAMWVQGR